MPIMALPPCPPSEWSPHTYWPDYQAMGDCIVCGHIRENCERINAEARAALAVGAIARWTKQAEQPK